MSQCKHGAVSWAACNMCKEDNLAGLQAKVTKLEAENAALVEAARGATRVCKRCNGTGYEGCDVNGGYYCDACKGKGY